MPAPWNETYLSLYERLLSECAKTIAAMGTSPVSGRPYLDEVILIHMVGPTLGGAESFLPWKDDGGTE